MTLKELTPDKLYLVALSGGADSVALTLMMKEKGLNVYALHCNFHLRDEESDRDEAFVRNFCNKHDIPLDVCHFDTKTSAKEHGVSIEMEARELRYTWFAEQANKLKAEAICVAHHKDDQAETLLLNLIRGTGLRGLSAMHPDRTINGLRILRPLLDITKQEILDYLASRHQEYVTDSTNLERDALRNRIRLDIIPMLQELNPNITDCLTRTATNVRMELDSNSQERYYHRWLSPFGFNRQQILDIFEHRPKEEGGHSVKTGLTWLSNTHILLKDRGKWVLEERKEYTDTDMPKLVVRELPAKFKPVRKDFLIKGQAFIDADRIEGPLALRRIVSGDRFRPYGMKNGTKLISDYLTDRKVNKLCKHEQFVVTDTANGNIVWLVNHTIDNRYCLTSDTKRIMQLSTER